MRYLVWVLRLLVFIAVLIFAVKNTDPVKVNFYADYAVQNVPLIVVMLVTFVVGAVFGLLLTVPVSMRRRREVARLRREVERLQAAAANAGAELNSAQLSPESIAPMSPL